MRPLVAVLMAVVLVGILALAFQLLRSNWDPKNWVSLFSFVVGGLSTALLTLIVSLQGEQKETIFATTLPFDLKSGYPTDPSSPDHRGRGWRQMEAGFIARAARADAGKPETPSEVQSYCEDLVRYQILRSTFECQDAQFRSEVHNSDLKLRLPKRPAIAGLENRVRPELLPSFEANRFLRTEKETAFWQKRSISLPEHTAARLDVKKGGFSLLNPFFTASIHIEPLGPAPGFVRGMGPNEGAESRSYIFKVTMRATFSKWTSKHWKTAEYKRWVDWTFEQIKQRFSDEEEQ